MSTQLGYARMAETHWRQHCPRMVRQLQASGRLVAARGQLQAARAEAQERTVDEMMALLRDFRRQGLTPQQAHDQAWELVREKYLLLPPEQD